MAAGRHIGFDVTRNRAIRSADPENPTIERNMKYIGSPVAEIWPFAYLGAYGTPILGGGEVVGGKLWHNSVSYRVSIVTVALSVTIWLQFAIECLRRSNQLGLGHFGPKFPGVPLVVDPDVWVCRERTSQDN